MRLKRNMLFQIKIVKIETKCLIRKKNYHLSFNLIKREIQNQNKKEKYFTLVITKQLALSFSLLLLSV